MKHNFFTCLAAVLFFCQPLFAQEFDELNNQAEKERGNKNYQTAIDLCTQAIKKEVNPRSYIIRADCRYDLKDYEAAIDDYNYALANYSKYYSENKVKARIYYWIGQSKLELRMYSAAISDYDMAVTYNYEYSGNAYWSRGVCYSRLGKPKEADDDYTKAIDRISTSEDLSVLYSNRGLCQVKLEDYEAAYNYYERSISYNSNNYKPYWFRGALKNREKKYDETLADYDKAIEVIRATATPPGDSDLVDLYRDKASTHNYLKQYDNALTDYNNAIEILTTSADTTSIKKLLNLYDDKAWTHSFYLKQYDEALADYDKAIEIIKTSNGPVFKKELVGLYQDKARMHSIYQQQNDKALEDYDKAIQFVLLNTNQVNDNDLVDLYRDQAGIYRDMKKYDVALGIISMSIGMDPNSSVSYKARGGIYEAMKKYDKAKADYRTAITLTADTLSKKYIYWDLYRMELEMLDYKNSLLDINKAIEMDSTYKYFYMYRSELYGYKKNYPVAIKETNTALAMFKSDSFFTSQLLAQRAFYKDNAGDFKGAVEDYMAILKYGYDSNSVYYELGRLFKLKLKNADLANANLEKAYKLSLEKNDTLTCCYISVLKGDKETAIENFLIRVEAAKNNPDLYKQTLYNMACIYALAGNVSKSFEYLERSFKAGYNGYLYLVNNRDLASLMKLPQWKNILAKYKVPVVKN